jgi:hypothetical protein
MHGVCSLDRIPWRLSSGSPRGSPGPGKQQEPAAARLQSLNHYTKRRASAQLRDGNFEDFAEYAEISCLMAARAGICHIEIPRHASIFPSIAIPRMGLGLNAAPFRDFLDFSMGFAAVLGAVSMTLHCGFLY